MKSPSDLTGFYRNFPSYLWVEDEETRIYLETAWEGEPLIKVLVAGGHRHIQTIVGVARDDGNTHVFGFRDRDFGASNRSRWNDDTLTVLVGEALEVENLLLDAAAIASCNVNSSGLGEPQVDQELLRLATPLVWWMSCRHTITEVSEAAIDDFIAHPSRANIRSQQDAENTIFQSRWWSQVLPALHPTWGNRATITTKLQQHEAFYRAMLQSGAWRHEFSGKEILRDLMTKIWTKKRPADPKGRHDFVQAIAEAQVKLKRVPSEIRELRTAIRQRIGH